MNDIEKAIEILQNYSPCSQENLYQAHQIAIKALTKQLVDKHCESFKWHRCKRKNGTEFLKLIAYDNEVAGYIEVGRFNISKNEYIQNNWSMNDIYEELR